VGGKVNMLRNIERGEKRKKLRSEMMCGIIEMNVASNYIFMRCGGCKGEKRIEIFKENGVWLRMGARRRRVVDVEDRYLSVRKLESNR